MTILSDIKKYSKTARLALLTTAGVVVMCEVDEIDQARVILTNSSVGNVRAERGFGGHRVTVYLDHVAGHWTVSE